MQRKSEKLCNGFANVIEASASKPCMCVCLCVCVCFLRALGNWSGEGRGLLHQPIVSVYEYIAGRATCDDFCLD